MPLYSESMSAKTSFKIATATFVAWWIYNASMTFSGAVGTPWYKSPVYVGGGMVFAMVTSGFAWHARRQGRETLAPAARTFTAWLIFASLCFVAVVLMGVAGWA